MVQDCFAAVRRVWPVGVTIFSVLGCVAATSVIEPPAGAFKIDVGFPPPGIRYVLRTVDGGGAATTATYAVLDEGIYGGKPVYQVRSGRDLHVYDKGSRNWIATVRDRQERFSALPHEGTFSWPLWVGKSWIASFSYNDRVQGWSYSPVEYTWTVETYEEVKVPAGTFKAFKLQSSPGRNAGYYSTIWYAPDIALIVKRARERISAHSDGPGKFVTELVEYRPAR